MRNLIIGVILVAAGAFLYVSWKIQRDVAEGVDMAVMGLSPYAIIQYDGVSATLTGELTVDGVRARVRGFDDEFFIDRIGIDTPSFLSLMKLRDMKETVQAGGDILPTSFGLMIEGLRMPTDADYGYKLHAATLEELGVDDATTPANECTGKYGLSPKALMAMGYDEYNMSMSARFVRGDRDYTVEIASNSADMWEVDAELILVGELLTELKKGRRYRPKMRELRVEYNDLSIQERMTEYCEQLGLSNAETQAAIISSFRFMGEDMGIEFDEYVMDPFLEFLEGGKTFVITAKPQEPVTLSQIKLYNPKDVPALLQLSAEVH